MNQKSEIAPDAGSSPQQRDVRGRPSLSPVETLSKNQMSQLVSLLNSGRYQELETTTRALLVQHPNSGFAWKALGLSLSRQGKDALQALRRATEVLPNDAEAHNNLGSAFRRLGQVNEALVSCRRAVAIKSDFAEAHNNLGNVLTDLGQLDDAMTSYRRALKIKPRYAEAHNNLGKALLDLEQFEAAVASYQQALEIHPQYAEAHNNLGYALLYIEQPEAAATSCRRALELKPDLAEAHNNLGNALLSVNDPEAAIVCCRKAIELKPDFPEAYNNLGSVFRRLGQLDEAIISYRHALQIKPDFAAVHNNLARVLLDLEQVDDAVKSCHRALELKPNFAEAFNILGEAFGRRGQDDAALAYYERALEIKPLYAMAHFNRSAALKVLSRVNEAEVSCRRALEILPNSAPTIALLAGLLVDQGHFAEAEDLYKRAISIQPDSPDAWSGIAHTRKLTTSDIEWLTEAQRVVKQDLPSRAEAQLHYAIAKYFDDTKDFEQAWHHYYRANEAAKKHTPKYDPKHQFRATELVRSMDRAWLSRAQVNANATARPVFVVGMPRSGTTLTEQILASHPAVFGAGELKYWSKTGASFHSAASAAQESKRAPVEMAGEYLELLEALSSDAARIVDKMPTNFLHLGLIHAGLPNARIIHIQRNPIDTCLSIYFQNFNHTHPYAIDLEYLAHFYGEYTRVMEHWRSVLPMGAMLELSYEELVENQEISSRKMIDFIGLNWDPKCLDFHQTDRAVITASRWQVKQKISKSSVARWRNYEKFVDELRPLLKYVGDS